MVVHLDHIFGKFEYQGYWIKFKVILVKWATLTSDTKFIIYDKYMVLLWSPRSRSSEGQGHCKFKVIPDSNCKCLEFYHEAGGGPSTEGHSCYFVLFKKERFCLVNLSILYNASKLLK